MEAEGGGEGPTSGASFFFRVLARQRGGRCQKKITPGARRLVKSRSQAKPKKKNGSCRKNDNPSETPLLHRSDCRTLRSPRRGSSFDGHSHPESCLSHRCRQICSERVARGLCSATDAPTPLAATSHGDATHPPPPSPLALLLHHRLRRPRAHWTTDARSTHPHWHAFAMLPHAAHCESVGDVCDPPSAKRNGATPTPPPSSDGSILTKGHAARYLLKCQARELGRRIAEPRRGRPPTPPSRAGVILHDARARCRNASLWQSPPRPRSRIFISFASAAQMLIGLLSLRTGMSHFVCRSLRVACPIGGRACACRRNSLDFFCLAIFFVHFLACRRRCDGCV
jgi:hypothetical protein